MSSGPFCRACGTRNDADAVFCESCGNPLLAAPAPPYGQPQQGYAPPPGQPPYGGAPQAQPPTSSGSKRTLVAFVVAGVALFGAYRFLPWQQWISGGAGSAVVDSASAADSASFGGIVEPHIMGNPNGPDAPPLGPYEPGVTPIPGGDPSGNTVTITGTGLDDPEMYFQLAASLEQQNSWSFAEGVYRQVIDFAPNNPKAHAGLAGTLLRQGRRDEAIAEAQRARALGHPGDHWVFRELGGS